MLELKIRELRCNIKGSPILKGITAVFKRGEMTAILGRNGAGKTTFIRCIAGLQDYRGEIHLKEGREDLGSSSFAYLPQLDKVISSLTTFETVLLGLTKNLNWKVSASAT